MNNQETDYYNEDPAPDSITTEFYTQQSTSSSRGSSGKKGSAGSAKGADTGQQLADTAGKVADQAKDVVGSAVDKAREQATMQIDAQKSKATSTLGAVAEAIRRSGDHLRDQEQAPIAQYADNAADQIERLSTYLDNKDITQIVNEVQHFARRQPAIFLGGALIAGLLAARFLKSSSDQAQIGTNQSAYGNTGSGYDAYGRSGAYSYRPEYANRSEYAGRDSQDTARDYSGNGGSSDLYGSYGSTNDTGSASSKGSKYSSSSYSDTEA